MLETHYVDASGSVDWMRAAVAVHLDTDTKFVRMRHTSGTRVDLPASFFFWHMGYVLSDERMWEKMNSWGHAAQVLSTWFEHKWLRWTPRTRDLFYRHPADLWPRTIAIDPRRLPRILHEHAYFPRQPGLYRESQPRHAGA